MDHLLASLLSPFPSAWAKDVPGYIASGFVLATFCMGSMRWLRLTAIASNFAFIYYAAAADLLPVLVLHSILLPVNITRLLQIQFARASGKRLLARSMVTAAQEDLARPVFIAHQALADPATALSLAEREQQRVACMLASRLSSPREAAAPPNSEETGRAAAVLLDKIDSFLGALASGSGLSAAQASHLTGLRSRDEVLRSLHEALGELDARLHDSAAQLPGWLADALPEGLGTILLIAEDATRSSEYVDLLLRMTSDRSALVERLRSQATSNLTHGEAGDHRAVYVVTALYERTVWLLQRYARLLEALNTELDAELAA